MTEWKLEQGNYKPPKVSIRGRDCIALTRNAVEVGTEEGEGELWQYEEIIIPKDVWEYISNTTSETDTGALAIDNSDGLFEVAEMSSDNSDALFELADYAASLEERIAALEKGE